MKGRLNKVVTFFVVIGLVISMAIINNVIPIKVSEDVQNIEQQPEAGMKSLGTITKFLQRFYTYDALIGKNKNESVWGFWDTEKKEENRLKNVYCVQTGANADDNATYDIYDAYDIDSDTIKTYFGDEEHYHHFLYILENMYLVGRSGSDKTYMVNATNEKIKAYKGSDYSSIYNSMITEINGLNMAGTYKNTVDAKNVGSDSIQFNLWKSGSGRTSTYTDPINKTDNYLAIVQRYLLASCIRQKDANGNPSSYAENPVTKGYKWNYFKYDGSYTSQGTVPSNAQKYADGLLEMLDGGFKNNLYDIDKYKNFSTNNASVDTSNAVYDDVNNRAGPFTVKNLKGYDISVNKAKYGQNDIKYTIVDEDGNAVNLSDKTTTEGKNFYIKLNSTLDGSNSLSLNFYIDYGDVPTARLLISKSKQAQLMATIDRVHQTKNEPWDTEIEIKPDIALKKYIYAVNGSTDAVPARLERINLSPLANETSTNAEYYMNKTPLKVQVGDTVTYAIQLFNEGKVNATAESIADYLPANLTFVRAYTDFEIANSPEYDGSNNITNTGNSSTVKLKNPYTDYIIPYDSSDTMETFKGKSQIIYVDCKVGTSNNNYVYTNIAEITEYRMEAGSDVDSKPSNWSAPSTNRGSSDWQNYSNGHTDENPSWFDNNFYNWGAQDSNGRGDDDDFDKIIIDHVDLALTKRIEGKVVEGTEEMLVPEGSTTNKSRIEISGYDEVKNGTNPDLLYNMNKKVAHVQREDQLVTVLTVYNEGTIDGTVKQITDYLPAGLNYNAEKTAELYGVTPEYEDGSLVISTDGNTIKYTYNKYSRQLTMLINNNNGITLQNLNDYDNDSNNHKVDKFEIKIVLDVSKSASGRLYNSAAITNYGYIGNNGTYYEAYTPGVDKDSFAMQDPNSLKSTHQVNHKTAEYASFNLTQYNKNDLQYQDDDDMDVVEVDYNPNFDLALRKYISRVEKNFDGPELVDEQDESLGYKKYSIKYNYRIPVIDEYSFEALNNTNTAEYYHDKLKVRTEKGDLVTYRIRVYNEGKGDDYFGRATEITDYLPEGLEYVSLEDGNDSNWSASASGNIIRLTYTGEKILPTDSIEILSNINKANEIKSRLDNGEEVSDEDRDIYNEFISYDEHDYYQEVGIICRVTCNDDYKIITNRAAITEDEAYEKVYSDETNYTLQLDADAEDRDSQPNELTNPNLDNWYSNNVINEGTPDTYYPGEQDDDDFDTIYVDSYDVKIVKTDGTNVLPGADFKVYKYKHISYPSQDFEVEEITDMENSIKNNGEGEYTTNAPTATIDRTTLPTSILDCGLENDVYIVKEIQPVGDHYNPFEGKYIKFAFSATTSGVTANYRVAQMSPVFFEIYNDNGDNDYNNDTMISYDFRNPNNIYNYVNMKYSDNTFTVTIKNPEIRHLGKYTVRLTKYGINKEGEREQIGGVQFDASGKFNGGNSVAIPHTGAKLESLAEDYVYVVPDSYTDEYIEITPENYETPDEISITETGIRADAVDSNGNLINTEYYTGLLNKELKIKVNKTVASDTDTELYYVDSLDLTLDGESFTGMQTLENGSQVYVMRTPLNPVPDSTHTRQLGPSETIIDVVIVNPYVEKDGTYNVNLVKYKKGTTTAVAGVNFTASAHINGKDEILFDDNNLLETDTSAVFVKENAEMSEEKITENDTYTLTEKDVGTNTDIYVGLDKPINLTVEKEIDKSDKSHWKYVIEKVTMKIGDESVEADGNGKTITVDGGSEVTIKYNSASKTIELIVTNPEKEGSFNINLTKYKYDENGETKPLAGAKFDITVNDGTSNVVEAKDLVSDEEGKISSEKLNGIKIKKDGQKFTVTVEETSAPTGYIGLAEPLTFEATAKSEGDKYVLDTKTITNEYIQAEVKEDEILIEAENRVEPVIHKGVKTVENQDSGYDKNEIQTWVINTTVPKGIKDYTKYIVTDTIDEDKTNNDEKRIAFINEANPASNVVVKYKGTETTLTEGTDYKVAFDTTTKKLTVTFINATEGNDNFVGGRSLTEETTLEITYKTQFTLDANGDPIGLNQSIPNQAFLTYDGNGKDEKTKESETPEVHTGGLGVYKYDKETNQALAGAKFRLVRTKEEAKAAVAALWAEDEAAINAIDWVKKYNSDGTVGDVWEVTTGDNGYAYFAGLEFGEDASDDAESNKTSNGKGGSLTYEYNWENVSTMYYLVETYVPEDYVLLEDVAAECVVKKDSFVKTDLTTYHKVGNEIVVPEGEYALEIVKYGKYENEDPHPIEGVIFSAKRTINGLAEEDLGNLTETDSTGRTLIGDKVVIDKDKVTTDDVYTIHEESIPETSEYYVGLEKDIKLTVSKQSVKSEDKKKWINSVTGIVMTIEGETVKEEEAGKKYTATVTKDGQALEVTAELTEDEEGGQYIKLTVEDPHKVGDFKLNIIKTIKGTNPEKPLPGTGFKVSIKNGDEALVDGNGKVLDGTNEFFVNDNGELVFEDLNIKKPGLTYDIEIEESTVPTGYIGISDNIKFSAVSKVKGNKLGIEDKEETKISNDVVIEFEEDEIWVDVENKPEPVIHKGVRTIRNQDAGYNGDEIQTWVINSSIEAGIEDYTQYIITDEIDYEKPNVEEKRIEYIPGSIEAYVLDDYEGNKVKDLTENTDYTVDFDEDKKIITITFINVDEDDNGFKAGRDLPAGNIIEIKYNTKFRLDDNGLIIGLQQSIENEATLTFGVRDHENNEKKSETPEVHTGAVGVLKFEDVNKNGEYDKDVDYTLKDAHFKIIRADSEDAKAEAEKALAAVLAGDKETLKTINFVKVRDEEGKTTDTDVELVTGEDGTAIYQGLEFGENASDDESNRGPNGKGGFEVYEYDWENAKTEYYLIETEAPYDYYLMDHYDTFEVSKNSFVMLDETTYYKEADKPKIYDLSLRKFITHVNGVDVEGNEIDRNITDRVPRVTLTDEFKDKENEEVTTAEYNHTKEPVIVQQGNTVTYTIRVYNEGPEDAYASIVKDDIPDGVKFIEYTEGDGSVNDEYRWKLVDENDNPVDDVSKAKYIVTDYLSMEQGEVKDGVNENLLKGYDSDTMSELDYRDLKVQFYVTEPNTSERIITNYAQITEMTNSDGKIETDRDSTPNKWIEGEDDQDVEHIRLLYFDLALRKWVTKAIVTSDGEEKVFETGHKAEDDPEDVVKVDLKKSKLDKVVVKFEYQIRITNEGRIGGWADEITDHIPDGLTFDQADNPIWTVVDSKTIKTDALKDTYLDPGESAEVTVVLRWENSGDNLGIKVNVAEISKDRNEYGVHDIDSTPGNYKWGEDDIDDAPVMLAVTTGNMAIGYTVLGLAVISIITVGAIAIKKVRND